MGSSYMEILGLVHRMQSLGLPITGLVEASKQLADAQSRRSAVAAQILPAMHWVGIEVLSTNQYRGHGWHS